MLSVQEITEATDPYSGVMRRVEAILENTRDTNLWLDCDFAFKHRGLGLHAQPWGP